MVKNNNTGFTLIELLVVVLIVGILSAVALPQYSTAVEKSRSAEALSLMNAIAGAAERYCFQKDYWPSNLNQLDLEVPAITASGGSSSFGGKSFAISTTGGGFSCTSTSNTYTIKATRRDINYVLETRLQVDADTDTIVAKRYCSFTGDKGEKFCNAITNGHNDDGKF